MPVTKSSEGKTPKTRVSKNNESKHDCCFDQECSTGVCRGYSIGHFGRKLLLTLGGILLLYAIVYLGTLIQKNIYSYPHIGKAEQQERTITVEAEGKVRAEPNVAMVSMGMMAEAATVAQAQQKNTEVMNALLEKVKALGISQQDLQTTNYNVSPQYTYTEKEGRQLTGYEVSQLVQVKIRDLSKANAVLALAGEVGANNVSGIEFTIDDREVYLAKAREEAVKNLEEKVTAVKNLLGVDVVAIVSYEEFEPQHGNGPIFYKEMGIGGADAPQVEPGTMDVVLHVKTTLAIE